MRITNLRRRFKNQVAKIRQGLARQVAAVVVASLMVFASQANAVLVFSTGFNGNLDRDAGTAGTAAFNNTPAGFSFVADNVGGGADTVIQHDSIDPEFFVDLTGTGVLGDVYTVVFDTKVSFSSGFQSLIGPPGADQDIFIRSTSQGGGVDLGSSTGSTNVNDDTWHRIVVTSGVGGAANLYVDGVQDTGIPATATTDDPLTENIGLFRDESGDNTAGSRFANFALYDTALDPGQVAQLGGPTASVITLDPGPSILEVVIDRDSGNVSIENNTGFDQDIKGYSIRSAAGALTEADADFLADGDASWVQFTAAGATGDLSEGHLTTDSLSNGSSTSLGPGWFPYFEDEADISFEYVDGTGAVLDGSVSFTGNGDASFERGDLDFDSDVDVDDWGEFKANFGTSVAGLSAARAYALSDLFADGEHNVLDVNEFRQAYDAANGPGSFSQMVGNNVPEPSTIGLALLGLGVVTYAGRRRRHHLISTTRSHHSMNANYRRASLSALVVAFVCGTGSAGAAEFLYGVSQGDANLRLINAADGSTTDLIPLTGPGTEGLNSGRMTGFSIDPTTQGSDDPSTWTAYATTRRTDGGTEPRDLVTIDLVTGATTVIGNTGVAVAGLTFAPNGTLYAVSGDGGPAPNEELFTVNKATGALTSVGPMGNGNDGEAIGYNPTDNLIYHFSGLRETDPVGREQFESINPATGATVVSILPAGTPDAEEGLDLLYRPGTDNSFYGAFLRQDSDPTVGANQFATISGNDGAVVTIGFFDTRISGIDFAPHDELVTLVVDPTNGWAEIRAGDFARAISSYEISSAQNLLSPSSWQASNFESQSLDAVEDPGGATPGAGNDPGETWEQVNAETDLLIEGFLLGESTFDSTLVASQRVESVGNVFDFSILGSGVDGDLEFRFATTGGLVTTGEVVYGEVTPPDTGMTLFDANVDGTVNNDDIPDFVTALLVLADWEALHPGLDPLDYL
ncbi:MAG: LamG-like jellyroll fold domain-containing protein, partial [Aeoliella sp.]